MFRFQRFFFHRTSYSDINSYFNDAFYFESNTLILKSQNMLLQMQLLVSNFLICKINFEKIKSLKEKFSLVYIPDVFFHLKSSFFSIVTIGSTHSV